jgi:hypothetical protein
LALFLDCILELGEKPWCIPNSSPEDVDEGSVAGDGSKGDKDYGMDSEKDVRSEVNSAANEFSLFLYLLPLQVKKNPPEPHSSNRQST